MHSMACTGCGSSFTTARSGAATCSPRCRKAVSRSSSTRSPTKEREIIERFDLNNVLLEKYAKTPFDDRPAYLENLIDRARAGETKIAEVLSNAYLLSRGCEANRHVHQPTISKLAHRFTTSTWGVHIRDAVRDRACPDTNLPASLSPRPGPMG